MFLLLFLFSTGIAQTMGRGFKPLTEGQIKEFKANEKHFKGAGEQLLKATVKSFGDVYASQFDLRTIDGLTDIRDQGQCGSCWAFSALATIESNYALKNGKKLDLSEQSILYCANPLLGSCADGGNPLIVFNWLLNDPNSFLENESDNPYLGQREKCISPITKTNVRLTNSAYFDRSNIESEEYYLFAVKTMICEYGALSAFVHSNTPVFANYKPGTTITEKATSDELDHVINVVGWDDARKSWLIRNSWGTSWGDSGYAWVGYDALGINFFGFAETTGEDRKEVVPEIDKKDYVVMNIVDNLGKTQEYQEIFVKIDDKEPLRFYMNVKNKRYHNYVPFPKGNHKLQIITKSIILKDGKRAMIFGVLKGDINIEQNTNYQLKYGKLIKDNILNLELQKINK